MTLSPRNLAVRPEDAERAVELGRASTGDDGHSTDKEGFREPLEVHELSQTYLRAQRIIAYDPNHRMTRYYDMLRNQLSNEHQADGGEMISVTAPSSGCGTTTTAINLALSCARLGSGSVLLVDLNPGIKGTTQALRLLPLSIDTGPFGVAPDSLVWISAMDVRLQLLRFDSLTGAPLALSDLETLDSIIDHVRRRFAPAMTILDLPPMLTSDLATPFLNKSDVTVLTLATGRSTLPELEVCRTFFGETKRHQVVLNRTGWHGL